MDWSDYIFPVNIEYNRKYIENTISRIKNWPIYSSDRGKTFFSTHRDIYFPINAEAIKIKNKLTESTTFSFSYVPPGHETGWHSDYNRGCTLILPIDCNPHLIKFKINDSEHDYYYSQPVITNAKTFHNGINYTEHNRYNLLFHFDVDYYKILNLVKNDQLVTKWVQDYNICLTFDFPLLEQYYKTYKDIHESDIIITNDVEIAKNTKKFVILIGEIVDNVSCITHQDNTPQEDIINAVKFILDSPGFIKHINLGV